MALRACAAHIVALICCRRPSWTSPCAVVSSNRRVCRAYTSNHAQFFDFVCATVIWTPPVTPLTPKPRSSGIITLRALDCRWSRGPRRASMSWCQIAILISRLSALTTPKSGSLADCAAPAIAFGTASGIARPSVCMGVIPSVPWRILSGNAWASGLPGARVGIAARCGADSRMILGVPASVSWHSLFLCAVAQHRKQSQANVPCIMFVPSGGVPVLACATPPVWDLAPPVAACPPVPVPLPLPSGALCSLPL